MAFDFEESFCDISRALNTKGERIRPYQWQIDLFHDWRDGRYRPIAIPTGLGKTSAILVWLLAMASQAEHGADAARVPRRLVYVVDRRTVVDQSTEVAEALLAWLQGHPDHPVTVALRSLSPINRRPMPPLSISTLRGERADNGDWKRDPTCPAIIVGTVYKIGSRLLFWGDGDGRTKRSMHAGLLGQDTLLLLDEAHLSPAFGQLARNIESIQRTHPQIKPFHFVELTATPGANTDSALRLSDADRNNPIVARRLYAQKILHLHALDESAKPADLRATITSHALAHAAADRPATAVLVYVTSPEDAASIAAELAKHVPKDCVALLTGTMRGHERDKLVEQPLFQRLMGKRTLDHHIFLVCTSAGEIGLDIDGDAAVFDLSLLDSFIQRMGRVNRTGGRTAVVDLVYSEPFATEQPRLHETLRLIQQLPVLEDGLNASPDSLSRLTADSDYAKASSPVPRMRALEPYLLDTWAMTELQPRIGPEVEPWLYGISDYEVPQTTIAWREFPSLPEQRALAKRQVDRWLSVYPLHSAEKASLRSDHAKKFLDNLAQRLDEAGLQREIVLIDARSNIALMKLVDLDKWHRRIANATLILPSEMGGLAASGSPDASESKHVEDVADRSGERERWSLSRNEDNEWIASRGGTARSCGAENFNAATAELERQLPKLRVAWMDIPQADVDDDEITAACLYLTARRAALPDDDETGAQMAKTQRLDKHLDLVGRKATLIGKSLDLAPALIERLGKGGHGHDRGKDRIWWQQAAGNYSAETLAKCYGRRAQWKLLRGYRHEFGSLLELIEGGQNDDLVLHLVASHHGRARPDFDTAAFDRRYSLAINEQARIEAQLRFERLQRQFGWWGLAYLEALLKCADVMGSADEELQCD